MRFLILACISILLSGCVYLDMAMLDTAEPLRQHKISTQVYMGYGLDMDTAVFLPVTDYDPEEQQESDHEAQGGTVTGLKGAIGLGEDYEVGLKTWQGEGKGYKLNLKKRLYNQDSISIAINPSVYVLSKHSDHNKLLYGVQIPVMLTYKPAKFLYATLQAHYNIDKYSREYDLYNASEASEERSFQLEHYGVVGGIRIKLGIFNLLSEIGCERIDAVNGPVTYVPVFAGGIGLELF